MFNLPKQKPGRKLMPCRCTTCGATDRDKFSTGQRSTCISCRKLSRESTWDISQAAMRNCKKPNDTDPRANHCKECDRLGVLSAAAFFRTCKARRQGISSAQLTLGSSCAYCRAHKLVDAGKLPDNIFLLAPPPAKNYQTKSKVTIK